MKGREQGDDLLFKVIMGLIKNLEFEGNHKRRIDPNGVHFIENGEVLIVGHNQKPEAKMRKCEAFGLCEVLRQTVSIFLSSNKARANLFVSVTARVPSSWVTCVRVFSKSRHCL